MLEYFDVEYLIIRIGQFPITKQISGITILIIPKKPYKLELNSPFPFYTIVVGTSCLSSQCINSYYSAYNILETLDNNKSREYYS